MIQKNNILALFLMFVASLVSAQTWNIEDLHFCDDINKHILIELEQDPDDVYVHNDTVTFKAQTVEAGFKTTTKWIRKLADRNCVSTNPEDCMVWCLTEVRTPTQKFEIEEKSYPVSFMEKVEGIWLLPEMAKSVKTKVLCKEEITDKMKSAVATALQDAEMYRDRNFLESEEYYLKYCIDHILDALKKYQTSQKFRVGNYYDLDSLLALGVVVQ
jgi:hypothetical protein